MDTCCTLLCDVGCWQWGNGEILNSVNRYFLIAQKVILFFGDIYITIFGGDGKLKIFCLAKQ